MMKHYTNPDIKTIALRTESIIALSNNTRNSIDFTSTDNITDESEFATRGQNSSCGSIWDAREE